MKEATGWWVRKHLGSTRRGPSAVDSARTGAKWKARDAVRWDAVWEGAGARAVASAQATADPAAEDAGQGKTLLDVAAAQAEGGGGKTRAKAPKPTGRDASDDRTRVGLAMAARATRLWEGSSQCRQGCAGCCTKARGYVWIEQAGGRWVWGQRVLDAGYAGISGRSAPQQADLLHVVCGECEGIPREDRETHRAGIRHAIRDARRTVTRKGVRGAPCA